VLSTCLELRYVAAITDSLLKQWKGTSSLCLLSYMYRVKLYFHSEASLQFREAETLKQRHDAETMKPKQRAYLR
jgi:hypothetical protein